MIKGEAICQEFCGEVVVDSKVIDECPLTEQELMRKCASLAGVPLILLESGKWRKAGDIVRAKIRDAYDLLMTRPNTKQRLREEIKCRLDTKYFTALVERMVQVGYCCTQVQKDLEGNTCTAWFESRNDSQLDF